MRKHSKGRSALAMILAAVMTFSQSSIVQIAAEEVPVEAVSEEFAPGYENLPVVQEEAPQEYVVDPVEQQADIPAEIPADPAEQQVDIPADTAVPPTEDITVDPGYTSVPTEGTEEYSETIPEEEPVGGDDTWSTLPEEESPDFIPDEVPTEPTRV